jgi:hypothetical protein
MKSFEFEVREEQVWKFTIDATCQNRAIKLFQEYASEYMTDTNLEDTNCNYDVKELESSQAS